MSKNYGLGRGLSSLIPQKNQNDQISSDDRNVTAQHMKRGVQSARSGKVGSQSGVKFQNRVNDERRTDTVDTDEINDTATLKIDITKIDRNPQQPRMQFDEEKLNALAQSIKEHGIIQPLVVSKKKKGWYELIAGERRLQASKRIGLQTVPVILRKQQPTDQTKLELALIENIQRHDLNVIEEAKGYKKLASDFGLSQEDIATRTGKSRSAVANRMRLLDLPVEIQRALTQEEITEGHAKVILSLTNSEKMRALFDVIMAQKLTVREAESWVKKSGESAHARSSAHARKSPTAQALEEQLGAYFNTKVSVDQKGNSGKITLSYFSRDELKAILAKLKV